MKKITLIRDGISAGLLIFLLVATLFNLIKNLWKGSLEAWILLCLLIMIIAVYNNLEHKIFTGKDK